MRILHPQSIFTICLLGVCLSCRDHQPKPEQIHRNFIFGRFNNECAGDQCITFFVLNKDWLSEVKNEQYPDQNARYSFSELVKLSQAKYELAKDLPSKIPEPLYAVKEKVIGCPDCTDGGGYYIEMVYNGEVLYWYIDAQNVPAFLTGFINEIHETINQLNQ